MIRRFFRHIKEGFRGVGRHLGMSLSSATASSVTLLLIAFFLVLTANLASLTEEIEESISLSVLLDYDVNEQVKIEGIQNRIENIDGVLDAKFRSASQEFDYYVSQTDDAEIKKFYELYRDDNPFHPIFLVNLSDSQNIETIKNKIANISGVYSVYDGGSNTYLLIDVLENVRLFGGIFVLALTLLAIYLIFNTIKITIDSRSKEIKIMRTVGAKNGYIRAPFLVEGIIIGVLGSIIPIVLESVGYYYLYKYTGGVLLGVLTLIPVFPFVLYLGLAVMVIGIVVGFIGSYISVCRNLRMYR